MSAHAATVEPGTPQSQVWERLWENSPSNEKDDILLARERDSKRWRLIVERVRCTFGGFQGLRTIELGSGRGDLSTLMAQEGACVTLLDSSNRALSQARRRFARLNLPATFQQADLFSRGIQQDYDVVLSSGVIEHFRGDDRTRVIRAHRDATREGGMTIISVPNAHCLPYRIWKMSLELRQCWPYGFEKPYSHRELARRARSAGLERQEILGCGFRQSMSTQLAPLLFARKALTTHEDSIFDNRLGLSLVLFGWRS